MKAEELMIGDWVKISSQFAQIYDVGHNTIGVQFSDGYDVFEPKSIEPIPITEDMLIRSGFEHDGTCEYILEQKTSEREGKKHFWIKVVPPQPDNDDWWSPDQTGFEVNNDICDMLLEGIGNVYVHQLQHVLQLAGINFYDVIKLKED